MITTIQIILLSISSIFAVYLVLLSIFALLEKNNKPISADELRRFAIVVPAYNEEGCISKTIKNLLDINYPKHLFDVFVIADNCTDKTAQIAYEEGAIVWERNNPEKRGKGHALRWCFDHMLSNDLELSYDSVVVVDADSLVSGNLLKVFNIYRENGAEVIQGYLTVAPKPGAWTSETIRIGLTLYNYVRPLGKRWIGCTAGLRGNGMCFSTSILKKNPWNAYSQTEDLEYGIDLLLNDVEVVFAPEIIGYNQIPEDARNAESQRERWELGRLPVIGRFAGMLMMNALKKRSYKFLDAFIDLIMPPLAVILFFITVMIGLNFALGWGGFYESYLFMWLWVALLGCTLLHALIGFIAADADKTLYRSLLYVPRYIAWKLILYVKIVLKGRTTEWIRTARE